MANDPTQTKTDDDARVGSTELIADLKRRVAEARRAVAALPEAGHVFETERDFHHRLLATGALIKCIRDYEAEKSATDVLTRPRPEVPDAN